MGRISPERAPLAKSRCLQICITSELPVTREEMLSLTCERSRIRQDYGLGRRQQVSAIRLLSERSDPRVNQRPTSSGSSRRFSYVLFVL